MTEISQKISGDTDAESTFVLPFKKKKKKITKLIFMRCGNSITLLKN